MLSIVCIACITLLVVITLHFVTSKLDVAYRSDENAPKYKYGIGYTNPILLRK